MLISSILYIHGVGRFLQVVLYPFQPFFKKPLDAETNDIKPRVMEKYTNEELLEVLPVGLKETKEVTSKQKLVLGQLYIYNGLNKKDSEGFFYRSNKDLSADCGIEEKTVIAAIRKLTTLELIETKRGSRASGASMYRVNEDRLKEYCNTNTVNYSEDYSKQIVEMADRIKELENTVKRLVDKITVIETANYSTDTDKDKELEKEKEINNNIINNILEETVSCKEPEEEKSEENLTEYQASSPIEEQSQASSVESPRDAEPSEETHIPTKEEQFKRWIQALEPSFGEFEKASTLAELDSLKAKAVETMKRYKQEHQLTNEELTMRVSGVFAERYTNEKTRIETKKHQMVKLFKFQSEQLN